MQFFHYLQGVVFFQGLDTKDTAQSPLFLRNVLCYKHYFKYILYIFYFML